MELKETSYDMSINYFQLIFISSPGLFLRKQFDFILSFAIERVYT